MKKIIEACIDRILEFDTQEEAAEYLEALRNKKTAFRIVNREARPEMRLLISNE